MKKLIMITSLAGTFMLIISLGCNENPHKHYADLQQANQEHMVEKGWVPPFTPPDARDIDFDEDMDIASVYGDYVSGDTAMLHQHCKSAVDSLRVPGYGPKWFDDDVKGANTAGKLRLKGYEVLSCDISGFNVAVRSSRNFVSYWSVRTSR